MIAKQNKKLGRVTAGFTAAMVLTILLMISGCGDSSLTGAGSAEKDAETNLQESHSTKMSPTAVKLDFGITSKRVSISESRLIESNLGNHFGNIVPVNITLNTGGSVQLQELQPNGIFALYLTADGDFSLFNTEGLNITLKSVFMEKCSFIDLGIVNNTANKINVTGFLAGE